jgi:hypothetical protein
MGRQTSSGDRYTLISSDTHAGGSHAQYREFLDPRFHEDFDARRGKYRNPFSDLGDDRRLRNWDDEMRNSQQDRDGVVGEVIFPNTVPPLANVRLTSQIPSITARPDRVLDISSRWSWTSG